MGMGMWSPLAYNDNGIIFKYSGVNRKVAIEISKNIEQILRHKSVVLLQPVPNNLI